MNRIAICSNAAFLLFLAFTVHAALRPAWNWDVVAYTYVVDASRAASIEIAHRETWNEVRNRAPAASFERLVRGDHPREDYHREQYTNPASLASMAPMYDVKIGYIMLIRMLKHFMSPITAMVAINVVSSAVLVSVVFLSSRHVRGALAILWLPVVGLFDALTIAKLFTPDALTSALYAAATLSIIKGYLRIGAALLIVGVAVRPDNLFLNLAVAVVLGLKCLACGGVVFVVSALIAAFANRWANHIGWWPHFYFTLVELQPTLVNFKPSFEADTYLKVLLAQIAYKLPFQPWLYAGLAVVAATFSRRLGDNGFKFAILIAVAIIASGLVRFVIFPMMDARVYAPHLFALGVIMLDILGREKPARRA